LSYVTRFALLYCAITAWFLWQDREVHLDFYRRNLFPSKPTPLWRPLTWLPYPVFGINGLIACQRLLVGCLASTVLLVQQPYYTGVARVLLALSAWLSLIYFGQVRNFPTLRRKSNHVPIILALLSICPVLGATHDLHEQSHWLFPMQCLIAQAYFSAGLCKLRSAGLTWCNGQSLQVYLLESYLILGTKQTLALAQNRLACRWASTAVILWELSFPTTLVVPALAPAYLLFGAAFHTASKRLMGIDYLRYFGAGYLSFVLPLLA
jgi:hypothetical protein